MRGRSTPLLVLTLSAASCAGANAPAPGPEKEEWLCGGELVPPTGWEQETAFADVGGAGARARAAEEAARKLEQRLCEGVNGCGALRARISTWKTGSNGKDVCAMAVLKAADLDAYRAEAQSMRRFDEELPTRVDNLLPDAARKKRPRVTIDRLVDQGIAGGARAEWLRARLGEQLVKVANLVDPPRGWAGDGVPEGVDLVVRGKLWDRHEGQIVVVEASLETLGGARSIVGAAHMTFPASAAPSAGRDVAPPTQDSGGLSLHLDAHAGGSVCAEEKTQLWLKSDGDAVVRVFNLYAGGEALLVWPHEESGEVRGGAKRALGEFEAIPVAGSEAERFIAVAAPTAAGLGRYAGLTRSCRLPATVAKELHEGKGVPAGAKVAADGYRLGRQGCEGVVSAAQREKQARALAGLPVCEVR